MRSKNGRKKIDIALVLCDDFTDQKDYHRRYTPPLGLYHLQGALDAQGFYSRVINMYRKKDFSDLE